MNWPVLAVGAALLGRATGGAEAGEVNLTIVNVVTPQDVKIWEPTSITAKKGDRVTLRLINKHADEHGYEIAAFGVKEVVAGDKTATVTFTADKAGVFPIKCQLHPAHVVGQLTVLE
ncbi:MAG TPA: cupredoxin domain-containing protein [Candidatus Binatia bacterium]|nr:cupredoxin domain-containing protein [Candidatus Binatia bacterium]